MKNKMIAVLGLLLVSVASPSPFAYSAETMGEKSKAMGNDAKRSAKKAVHRAKEAMCAEGDAQCLKRKAAHRATEGKDYVEDKASEAKEAIDNK